MNEEDWCIHYKAVLDKKMDKSRGFDPAACWVFTSGVAMIFPVGGGALGALGLRRGH